LIGITDLKQNVHAFLNRRYALILTYHSVIDRPTAFDLWTHISLKRFEEHMSILKQSARVISLKEMAEGIRRHRLPARAVALTFDDGFANNFTRAFPILRKFGLPATIFLSTGFIGGWQLFWPERLAYQIMLTTQDSISVSGHTLTLKNVQDRSRAFAILRDKIKKMHPGKLEETLVNIENMLGVPHDPQEPLYHEWLPLQWDQVREMADSGLIEFGGHTHTHSILARLDDKEAEIQIADCRKALQDNLDQSVTSWAYPNGTSQDFEISHRMMLERYGFKIIVTAMPAYISPESDPGELGRWNIGGNHSVMELRSILAKQNRWGSISRRERLRTVAAALDLL